jgi:hypothetical protein
MNLRDQFRVIWQRGGGFFGLLLIGAARIFGKDAARWMQGKVGR